MKSTIFRTGVMLIFLALTSALVEAEVKLPAIFSDNMVMQQQTEAAIWGTATEIGRASCRERV